MHTAFAQQCGDPYPAKRDPSNPLLDRLRFLSICASNLDEFFEVRVAGLQEQLYENLEPQDPPPDGMGPLAQLLEIARRAHDFVGRMYETWYKMTVLLQSGLDISPVITHRFSYRDFQEAFRVMRSGNSGKVILNWEELRTS